MAGDLPSRLAHRRDSVGISCQRLGDAEDGDRDIARVEQAPETPEPGARAVFIHRLHVHMPLARPGLRPENIRQERLGRGVAMQDRTFAAFLVVEDELDGDTGAAGPARIGRIAAVADEIARIWPWWLWHIFSNRKLCILPQCDTGGEAERLDWCLYGRETRSSRSRGALPLPIGERVGVRVPEPSQA